MYHAIRFFNPAVFVLGALQRRRFLSQGWCGGFFLPDLAHQNMGDETLDVGAAWK